MSKLVLVGLGALVLIVVLVVILVKHFVARALVRQREEVLEDLLEANPSLFINRPDHTHMISGTIREGPHPGGINIRAHGHIGLSSQHVEEVTDALSLALARAFGPMSNHIGREARDPRRSVVVVNRPNQRQESQRVGASTQQPTRKSRYERDPVI